MGRRTVTLFLSSCLGVDSSAQVENLIGNAMKIAKFDSNLDTFQLAVVTFGEGPSFSESISKDIAVLDAGLVGRLLEAHQITSIPCVVVVQKISDGTEVGQMLPIQDESSVSGTADEHCDAAIEAYNEFNIHEAVSR